MVLINTWVGYLERSYEQVKASLLNRLTTVAPEVTDHSEGNILIVILSMFSGVVEHLNYYIDNMAREAFLQSAQLYASVVKLVALIDYRIKARIPASVNIKLIFTDGSGVPQATTGTVVIPTGTIISTSNGIPFRTTVDYTIPIGVTEFVIGASQFSLVLGQNLGLTTGAANQQVIIGDNYVHNSISLYINGYAWQEKTTFARSNSLSQHFIVDVNTSGQAYVMFGDGTFGQIPPIGYSIIVNYRTSTGSDGNLVSENTITNLGALPTIPGVTQVDATNPLKPSGGSHYEGMAQIKFRAPLSLRTLERAVSYQDYVDVALLAPGVEKAKVRFCCGESSCIQIYIAPNDGGIAQIPLLQSTETFFCDKKMVLDGVCVRPAGITPVPITILVKPRITADPIVMAAQINSLIDASYGFNRYDINDTVYLSDIYQGIDALPTVEALDITAITTRPYARPYNHLNQLEWTRITLPDNTVVARWKIQYQGSGNFGIWRDSVFMGVYTQGILSNIDSLIEFTILPGAYVVGNTWDFSTYPYGVNQYIDDFSVPMLSSAETTILIQNIAGAMCNPSCNP